MFISEIERARAHAHVGEGEREGDAGSEAGFMQTVETLCATRTRKPQDHDLS